MTIGRKCALTRGRWISGCAGTFWRKKCRGFYFSDSNCLSGPGWAGVGAAHANRRKKCNYHACVLLGVRLCVGGCVSRDRPHCVAAVRACGNLAATLRYTCTNTTNLVPVARNYLGACMHAMHHCTCKFVQTRTMLALRAGLAIGCGSIGTTFS